MLIRIVKMTFKADKAADFLGEFEKRKIAISGFKGCAGVDLLRDINDNRIFFTYSKWDNETSLNQYRDSELFAETWTIVKKWFDDKPQAWSTQLIS